MSPYERSWLIAILPVLFVYALFEAYRSVAYLRQGRVYLNVAAHLRIFLIALGARGSDRSW